MEDPNYIFLNSKIFSFLKPKLLKKADLGRRIVRWNVLFSKQQGKENTDCQFHKETYICWTVGQQMKQMKMGQL